MTKYVLDTNVLGRADRDGAWAEELVTFYTAFLPVTLLHAVVVQELLLGAVDVRSAVGPSTRGMLRPSKHDNRS